MPKKVLLVPLPLLQDNKIGDGSRAHFLALSSAPRLVRNEKCARTYFAQTFVGRTPEGGVLSKGAF